MKSGGLPIKFVPVGDAGRMTAEQIDREAVAALVEQGIERYQEALGAIVRMVNAPNKRRANEIWPRVPLQSQRKALEAGLK